MKRETKARWNGILAAHGENTFQQLRLLVPEHDAEDVVIHDFLDAFGDAAAGVPRGPEWR